MRWVFVVDKRCKDFCIKVVVKDLGGTSLEVCCEGERRYKFVGGQRISKFACLICCEGQKKITNLLACLGFVEDS